MYWRKYKKRARIEFALGAGSLVKLFETLKNVEHFVLFNSPGHVPEPIVEERITRAERSLQNVIAGIARRREISAHLEIGAPTRRHLEERQETLATSGHIVVLEDEFVVAVHFHEFGAGKEVLELGSYVVEVDLNGVEHGCIPPIIVIQLMMYSQF